MKAIDSDSISGMSIFKWVATGFCVLVALILLMQSFYTVDAGERAVLLRWGKISSVESEGLHFKIPFMNEVKMVEVRTKKAHIPASAGTVKLQTVHTEVAVNYHLNKERVDSVYANCGFDVEDRILEPRVQEVVKAIIAKYVAEDLLQYRQKIKDEMTESLKKSVAPYFVTVEDIQITDFSFEKGFTTAIEEKQTSAQYALKAENDLKIAEIEGQKTIVSAKAQAEAIKIQSEAIRAQGGAEYVKLKWIEAWKEGGSKVPNYIGGGNPMAYMDITK